MGKLSFKGMNIPGNFLLEWLGPGELTIHLHLQSSWRRFGASILEISSVFNLDESINGGTSLLRRFDIVDKGLIF